MKNGGTKLFSPEAEKRDESRDESRDEVLKKVAEIVASISWEEIFYIRIPHKTAAKCKQGLVPNFSDANIEKILAYSEGKL